MKHFTVSAQFKKLLLPAALLLTALFVLGWTAWAVLEPAAQKSKRELINDNYTTISQAITDSVGVTQQIQVKANTKLYGFATFYHIYNQVQHGTLFAELLHNNEVIATANTDMTTILDNTYRALLFDRMIQTDTDTEYTLHLYIQPASADSKIAIWKSETAYDGFALTENGAAASGTIALSYITAHVGNSIYRFYLGFCLFVVTAAAVLYYLAFVKKEKIHTIFAAAALFIGTLYCVFSPISGEPDEYVHAATAYYTSNAILGIENSTQPGTLTVRECDAQATMANGADYSAYHFQQIAEQLFTGANGHTSLVTIKARNVGTYYWTYLPSALGITLARLLHFGYIPLYVTGRLFSLLMYIAIVTFAIRLTPVFKNLFALCALLPMCLQLAASYSYDGYVLYLTFLFLALIFRLAYGKQNPSISFIVVTTIVLIALTPVKTIYILLGMAVVIIPTNRFSSCRTGFCAKYSILLAGLLVWCATNLTGTLLALQPATATVSTTQPVDDYLSRSTTRITYPFEYDQTQIEAPNIAPTYDTNSDLLPNGDSRYYFGIPYILHHPRQTAKIVLNSFTTLCDTYLQSILGTRYGELILVDIHTSWLLSFFVLGLLLWGTIPCQNDFIAPTSHRLLFLGLFAAIFAAVTLVSLIWTPINYTVLFGWQGRYLLPGLLPLMIALSNKHFTKASDDTHLLLYSYSIVNFFILVNLFYAIALH